MYFNALIATGLVAGLVTSDSACGPLSLVTVTVNAPPVTKTLAPPLIPLPHVSDASIVSAQAVVISGTSIEATATLSLTSFQTDPNVVSAPNVQEPGYPQDSSFSFAIVDGTTTWLGGKTPYPSAGFVTNTRVVTIVPQPVTTPSPTAVTSIEDALASDGQTTTSYTTISSTSIYTHHLTAAPSLQPALPSSPLPNLSPYLGHKGWNTTLTTLQRLRGEAAPTDSSNAWPTYTATWATSVKSDSIASLYTNRKQARQVGAIVTATIDGVVVSWTNSYAGEQVTQTPPSSVGAVTSALPNPEPSNVADYGCLSSTQSDLVPTTTESPLTLFSTETSYSTIPLIKTIQPSPPFSNATQTTPETSATATSCGSDTGHFTINFDDLPHFSAGSNDTDIPPIFNPYRKLFFNAGYGYVPPPSDPYAPISPPQLAVWNVYNDSVIQESIDAGLELRGEIGAGPRVNESAYWIDAYSVWIGCANSGPAECRLDFIGFDQFDAEIATQTLLQPPCPSLVNCKLVQVEFSGQFRYLAGLQILAYVNKTPITFYMDDLSLGWSNNTCAAQVERSSAQ
ncbi:MAG: hypothetical protein Q9202_000036 [Teloschistes flavicans]